MINAMSTSAPLGIPFGQADASALPRAMFTRVISSFTVTSPLPSQSPTQMPEGSGVNVGVGLPAAFGVGDGAVAAPGKHTPRTPAPVFKLSQWPSAVHSVKPSHATPSFVGSHCPVLGLQKSAVQGLWSTSGHVL